MFRCLEAAGKILSELARGDSQDVSARDGFLRFLETAAAPRKYISTGLPRLDRAMKLSPGDYLVVGGRPSAGKTALTLQFLLHMAKQYRCVYYSLETRADKLFDRILAAWAGIPLEQIKNGDAACLEQVRGRLEEFARLQLTVTQAAGWSVPRISAHAARLRAQVIFIDYLSLVRAEGGSLYERVSAISRELREVAQSRGILVTALSQLNRQGAAEPGLAYLRESGQGEQDADCVLLLHGGPDADPNHRQLILAKNKEGLTGRIPLRFRGEFQRFEEITVSTGKGDVS